MTKLLILGVTVLRTVLTICTIMIWQWPQQKSSFLKEYIEPWFLEVLLYYECSNPKTSLNNYKAEVFILGCLLTLSEKSLTAEGTRTQVWVYFYFQHLWFVGLTYNHSMMFLNNTLKKCETYWRKHIRHLFSYFLCNTVRVKNCKQRLCW